MKGDGSRFEGKHSTGSALRGIGLPGDRIRPVLFLFRCTFLECRFNWEWVGHVVCCFRYAESKGISAGDVMGWVANLVHVFCCPGLWTVQPVCRWSGAPSFRKLGRALDYTTLDYTTLDYTTLDWTRLDTRLDNTRLDYTTLDWPRLARFLTLYRDRQVQRSVRIA